MQASPNMTFFPSPGNNTFTVSAAAGNTANVNFYADEGGACLLASVAAGGSATFFGYNGFFYQSSANSTWSITTSSQSFQATPTVNEWKPTPGYNIQSNSTLGLNSLYFQPIDLSVSVAFSRLNMFLSVATTDSLGNATGSAGYTISLCLYSLSGTNSDAIASFFSQSQYIQFSGSSSTNLSVSQPAGVSNSTAASSITTTFANANATTWLATSVGGFRAVPFPIGSTLGPGRYWLAVANSWATANGSLAVSASVLQETFANQINYQPFGGASSASNASYPGLFRGLGLYSATSGAFPATVPLTGGVITQTPSPVVPWFNVSNFVTNASEI